MPSVAPSFCMLMHPPGKLNQYNFASTVSSQVKGSGRIAPSCMQIGLGQHWVSNFQHKQVQKPLLCLFRSFISGTLGSFQSGEPLTGRKAMQPSAANEFTNIQATLLIQLCIVHKHHPALEHRYCKQQCFPTPEFATLTGDPEVSFPDPYQLPNIQLTQCQST